MVAPGKPQIFYGRDGDVEIIADRLTSSDGAHVAILGAGGLEKTSVALAVIQDRRILERFPDGGNWLPCIEATTLSSLLDLLAKTFKVTGSGNDRLNDIVSFLRASPKRRLLVLDNFETPWDIEGRQGDVDNIFSTLTGIPDLSLMVTMRGTGRPSEDYAGRNSLSSTSIRYR